MRQPIGRRIVTLTLNPAVDLSFKVDELDPTKKLRCYDVRRDPGGGGVNVARAIHRLGEKATAADAGIRLVHGEPMLFGKDKDKGLVFDETSSRFRVVSVGTDAPLEAVARHDETSLTRATALAALGEPGEPMALGVLYARPQDDARPGFSRLSQVAPMSRDQLGALLSAGG